MSDGGLAINGYVVRAIQVNTAGTVLATRLSAVQPPATRVLTMVLPAGLYQFEVIAQNALGRTVSSRSTRVTAQ